MTLSKRSRDESPEERLVPLKRVVDRDALLVHEVYASVQGESTWAGVPCAFVRLTGCHLRCGYCDTEHAFHAGVERSIDDVVADVRRFGLPLVEVTGGEPLLQKPAFALLARLCDEGLTVLLETSGGVSIAGVDPRVRVILDVKTPGSGEAARNVWANLPRLLPGKDEVKLVIVDDADYAWAKDVVAKQAIPPGVTVLFSPAAPTMDPARLAERIVADRLPVRFQVQLHKVLWGDRPGV
jgi:7-carboxy-7-deazaguanine synthase